MVSFGVKIKKLIKDEIVQSVRYFPLQDDNGDTSLISLEFILYTFFTAIAMPYHTITRRRGLSS
jgi:hypothetical protein